MKRGKLIFLAILFAVLSGCGGGGGGGYTDRGTMFIPTPGTSAESLSLLRGLVFDTDGRPIQGVQIQIQARFQTKAPGREVPSQPEASAKEWKQLSGQRENHRSLHPQQGVPA